MINASIRTNATRFRMKPGKPLSWVNFFSLTLYSLSKEIKLYNTAISFSRYELFLLRSSNITSDKISYSPDDKCLLFPEQESLSYLPYFHRLLPSAFQAPEGILLH